MIRMQFSEGISAMKSLLLRTLLPGLLMLAAPAFAQTRQPLTLREALDQALQANPQIALAQANEREAEASVRLARTQWMPQLAFTEEITRGNDPVYAFGTRLRQRQFTQADFALNALNRPLPIGNFASRFTGQWQAFDSFRTQRQIRQAWLFRQSVHASSKSVDQQLILHVVAAYEQALYAQRQLEVAQGELKTAEALEAQAADHVKAGLAVDSDHMAAQVNTAARKQEKMAAEGALELAWVELREAMGAPDLPATPLAPIEARNFPSASLDEELAMAQKMRPDLTAATQARAAQFQAVGAARSSLGPRIAACGSWEADRASIASTGGHNWMAGAQITIDILPLARRAQLAHETAVLERADAQTALARQQIRLQVNQAHIQRKTTEQQLETAHLATAQAAESLRIVRNRYAAGLATITDLLRAEDAGRQAQSNYWGAVYQNAIAYAQLLFAQGTLSPDAAEVLQ